MDVCAENSLEFVKNFIDDDIYTSLSLRFLREGKGRKPDVKEIPPLSKKLLLQLNFIRIDGAETEEKMSEWFHYLYPDVVYPLNRIPHVIRKLCLQAQKSDETALRELCSQKLDFDRVSPSLQSIGISRGVLEDSSLFESFEGILSNEIVLDIDSYRKKEGKETNFTLHWVNRLIGQKIDDINLKTFNKYLSDLRNKKNKLSKDKKRAPEKLVQFLNEQFDFVLGNKLERPVIDSEVLLKKTLNDQIDYSKRLEGEIENLYKVVDEERRSRSEMQADLKKAEEEVLALKRTMNQLMAEKKSAEEKNSLLQRKVEKTNNLLKYYKRTRKYKTSMVREDQVSKQPAESSSESCRVQLSRSRRKEIKLKNIIDCLKDQVKCLQKENLSTNDILMKKDGAYTNDVRTTVMQLQGQGNVAASKCGNVIRIVSENLFHKKFKEYPSRNTCLNIASEGHSLAFQQLYDVMKNTPFTLHMDGTSRGGAKIVGTQISSGAKNFSLGFSAVAKEDADTMLELALKLIEEICDATDGNTQEVSLQIFRNFTHLMTDRAASMKLLGQKLNDTLHVRGKEEDLILLHCNAHFLLGLSDEIEKGLKQLENGRQLGRDTLSVFNGWSTGGDSATIRLTRTTCDVLGPRGDDKHGVRGEWIAFCDKSLIPSFRSNRFNCLFEGAISLLHHKDAIISLLNEYLGRKKNLKLQSVVADMKDDYLEKLIYCLALVFIKISNPYWQLVTSKSTNYQIFCEAVQKLYQFCRNAITIPETLVTEQPFEIVSKKEYIKVIEKYTDMFGFHSEITTIISKLMEHITAVTERQLQDFLKDGKIANLVESGQIHDNTPITNLLGEKAFGDFDFDLNKRRRCSLHHRSSIQLLKKNNVAEWVKGQKEQDKLMKQARQEGRLLRKKHGEQERLVIATVRERLLENEREKREKELKVAQEKEDIARRVHSHGGPCVSFEDVERLKKKAVSGRKYLDSLKDEVRYIKIVLTKKCNVKLSATVEEIERGLKEHLTPGSGICSSVKKARLDKYITEEENKENDESDEICDDFSDSEDMTGFSFSRQGMWVAVYYDNTFYIGQVLNIESGEKALVKFMDRVGVSECFRWPRTEDVTDIQSMYVFDWGFDVSPSSSNSRIWKVDCLRRISARYHRIKNSSDPCRTDE